MHMQTKFAAHALDEWPGSTHSSVSLDLIKLWAVRHRDGSFLSKSETLLKCIGTMYIQEPVKEKFNNLFF